MTDSQRDKMLRGELYLATDPELMAARVRARDLWQRLNVLAAGAVEERAALLRELLGSVGPGATIEPPFYCDYGTQVHLGADVFVNFNCVFLDPAPIHVGDQAMLAPSVQLLTADHPREAHRPITIGPRVWIGAGSIICPGVTIGADTTIGAGSVVVRNVPGGVVAAGNPCRVIRSL
jgi:maltose O-acetyltransferase